MYIAVIDDDNHIITKICEIINLYAVKKQLNISIDEFTSAEDFLNSYKAELEPDPSFKYDAIFLDIEMGELSGIELGGILRNELNNYTTQIIYITSHAGYMPKAYDNWALGYIVKPFESENIYKELDKLMNIAVSSDLIYTFVEDRVEKKVLVKDIVCFTVNMRRVTLITTDAIHEFNGSLKQVFSELPEEKFLRINKNTVVQIGQISGMTTDSVILKNGESFEVSRKYYRDIMERIE